MQQKQAKLPPQLSQTPGPVMLSGAGVGDIIAGMYFGWSLGLEKGGTYGLPMVTEMTIAVTGIPMVRKKEQQMLRPFIPCIFHFGAVGSRDLPDCYDNTEW